MESVRYEINYNNSLEITLENLDRTNKVTALMIQNRNQFLINFLIQLKLINVSNQEEHDKTKDKNFEEMAL